MISKKTGLFPTNNNDLEVGQICSVIIKKHKSNGVIVAVNPHLDGFVPKIQLNYTQKKYFERIFPVGKKVLARVLKLIPAKLAHFTLKSVLIESELPILTEISKDLIGTYVEGVIVKIRNTKGLLIEFYNGLKGFVPQKYTATRDLNKTFNLGQTVKSHVFKVLENKKFILSMIDNNKDLSKTEVTDSPKKKSNVKGKTKKVALNKIVNCIVKSIDEEKKIVHGMIEGLNIFIEIPIYHLSDNPELCHAMFVCLKEGDRIEDAVIFNINEDQIVVTLKPSFRQWVEKKKSLKFCSLKPGNIYPCVVDAIYDDKLSIRTINGLVYPLYKSNISVFGSKLNIMQYKLTIGQTLLFKCIVAHKNKKETLLSAKFEDVLVSFQESSFLMLNYLQDLTYVKKGFLRLGGMYEQLANYSIGEIVDVEIRRIFISGAGGVVKGTEFQAVVHGQSRDMEIGAMVKAKILFVNFDEECLELSANEISYPLTSTSTKELNVGDTLSAYFVLIKPEFMMAKVKVKKLGQIVYIPSKRHFNDFQSMSKCFRYNMKVNVIIKYVTTEYVLADLNGENYNNNKLLDVITLRPLIHFKNFSQMKTEIRLKTKFSQKMIDHLNSRGQKLVEFSRPQKLPQIDLRLLRENENNKQNESKMDAKKSLDLKKKGFVWKTDELIKKENENDEEMFSSEDEDCKKASNDCITLKSNGPKVYNCLMDPNFIPKNPEQFEEFLEKFPENSSMWIEYSNHYLKNSEKTASKDVIRRGISSCLSLATKEKLTLWKTLMSIQDSFGMENDLKFILEEASSQGGIPQVDIQLALAEVYTDSKKLEDAKTLYNILMKKYPEAEDVWVDSCRFYFKHGQAEESRKIFDRGLTKLGKNKAMPLIASYSKFEYHHGDPDKAILVYEALVKNFPQNLEIWYNYYDTLVKDNKFDSAREILERMCDLKLPLSDMRSVFLKFQQFETQHGTPDSLASIKRKAANYIAGLV